MNYSLYKIYLDVHKTTVQTVLHVKRNDTGRKIIIGLTSGGKAYPITDECIAVFRAKKPDGTVLYNHCDIEDNLITYELTAQTSASEGLMDCEVTLYGTSEFRTVGGDTAPEWKPNTYFDELHDITTEKPSDWETNWHDYFENAIQLTSPRFEILVDDAVQTDDEIESKNEFSELLSALARLAGIELNERTRERNEADRKSAELERVRNELIRIENENKRIENESKRTGLYVRYSFWDDGHDMTDFHYAGQDFIGIYTGKQASESYTDYTWSYFPSNLYDVIIHIINNSHEEELIDTERTDLAEYAADTGINGWKISEGEIGGEGRVRLDTLMFNGTDRDLTYDDIVSGKSTENITEDYSSDDYGKAVKFKNSNGNDVTTKEWVMNYVAAHGGSGVPELMVEFVDASPDTFSATYAVMKPSI